MQLSLKEIRAYIIKGVAFTFFTNKEGKVKDQRTNNIVRFNGCNLPRRRFRTYLANRNLAKDFNQWEMATYSRLKLQTLIKDPSTFVKNKYIEQFWRLKNFSEETIAR